MGEELPHLPESLPDDDEDVAWGLQTATALWARGERREALVWIRRAAEAAGSAGDDLRAVSLAKSAVAIEDSLSAAAADIAANAQPGLAGEVNPRPMPPPLPLGLPPVGSAPVSVSGRVEGLPPPPSIGRAPGVASAGLQLTLDAPPREPVTPTPNLAAHAQVLGALASHPTPSHPSLAPNPVLRDVGNAQPTEASDQLVVQRSSAADSHHPPPTDRSGQAPAPPASPYSLRVPQAPPPPRPRAQTHQPGNQPIPSKREFVPRSRSATFQPGNQPFSLHAHHADPSDEAESIEVKLTAPSQSEASQAQPPSKRNRRKQRAPILDPWADNGGLDEPPVSRHIQNYHDAHIGSDEDVVTSASTLDAMLRRKAPPPPPPVMRQAPASSAGSYLADTNELPHLNGNGSRPSAGRRPTLSDGDADAARETPAQRKPTLTENNQPRSSPPVAPPRPSRAVSPAAGTMPPAAAKVDLAPVATVPPELRSVFGLPLDRLDVFADVPPELQQKLVAGAALRKLEPEEEVQNFGGLIVASGAAVISASVADITAKSLMAQSFASGFHSHASPVPARVVAVSECAVALWDKVQLEEALCDCPWVVDELRRLGDLQSALVGATLGPFGDLDDQHRQHVFDRLTMKSLKPGEVLMEVGVGHSGLMVLGIGQLLAGDQTLSPGDLVEPQGVLDARPISARVVAGAEGAVVLVATRASAVELLSVVPMLIELLR